MNRALYIVGIVFSFVFMIVIGYYINAVENARFDSLFGSFSYSSYDPYGYNSYSSYGSGEAEDLTMAAGLWSLFFFLSFVTIDVLGLIKAKTTTTKVISIIGLSISFIYLLWNFAMMSSPGSISFDEVGGGFGFYAFIMMAFMIVGLVQSVKFHKRKQTGAISASGAAVKEEVADLLDS